MLARYGSSNGWLDGQPAVTERLYGQGRVTFIGAYLDDDSQQKLLDQIVGAAGVQPDFEAPAGVEARRRIGRDGEAIFILINHTRQYQRVALPWPAREHLHGQAVEGEITLGAYEVGVVTKEHRH